MPYSDFNLSDLQDYVPHNPCDDNRYLGALSGASYAARDSNPVEAIDTPLLDPTFQFCADVLSSISRLFPGLRTYHETKFKDTRGATIDEVEVQGPATRGASSRHQDNHQPIPGEIEGFHNRYTVYATPSAYTSSQYEILSPPAMVPVHTSSLQELINCRDATSEGSRREPSTSPSIPAMGQPGPSHWHQDRFDEPFHHHPSVHPQIEPSALHLDSESTGFSTHQTVPDAVDGTLSHLDNGKNLMLDQHTAPIENVDGNDMSVLPVHSRQLWSKKSISFKTYPQPLYIGGSTHTAQHQGIFSDNSQSWLDVGEDSNATHGPSMCFSSRREENKTLVSVIDGSDRRRSGHTKEPVEQQDINKVQTNDGGHGERRMVGHGQTIGSGESGSRKRQREESDSEMESAGGSHKPKKPKVKESPDSVPGDQSTGVQGARGKRRNLNPRAPAMMKLYAHNLTPLTTPEAKEGGFVPLVTADTKAASKAFSSHQMSVDMDSMTIV
ncbi:hypothetical protein JR316_0001576 [Psilocybe cubensis]|uniref:Uncharacterized protein n=2 Tax=Psilocybe cubensis TaxID=181762 RepID=A0ACB8HAJ3_PSICU|nr:hypothetical protein JR316_0001576 [Psilocybe cubensis]KAH9484677.1 hypothetical protein JR316_0001576 [Psilocybe cubensis]